MTRIEIAPDTLHRSLGGETVVINLETGLFFSLDRVGRRIWELIEEHREASAIEDILVSEFDEKREKVHADLQAFLDELTERALVVLR
jgi:hypothetical protein